MRTSHALNWVAIALAGIFAGAATAGETSDHRSEQHQVGSVLGAQSKAIVAGDFDAIATWCDLPARWNRAAAPLVRDYLDPNVSPDRWVRSSTSQINELRKIYIEMQTATMAIADRGIRNTFDEFRVTYKGKLDSATALQNAVARGDAAAEQAAQKALSASAAQGQVLAQAFLDRLRPFVDSQVLAAELQKRGRAIGEILTPSSAR